MPSAGSSSLAGLPDDLTLALTRARLATGQSLFRRLPGGRTNRVWLMQGAETDDVVVKLYAAQASNTLFPNDPAAELTVLEALSPHRLAPEPFASGIVSTGSWLAYRHYPGPTWQAGVKAVARLLGRVHACAAPRGLRVVSGGSADLMRQGTELLAPLAADPMARVLQSAKPQVSMPAAPAMCLIHGDPVPGNLVDGPDGLRLIDWQCPAWGDPAEDLLMFLSPTMQLLYCGRSLSIREQHDFLAAYPDQDMARRARLLQPLAHWRMACYCLNRLRNGATDYAAGLRAELAALGVSDIGQHQ